MANDISRIKTGMSRQKVEAILGPPGDYSTVNIGRLSCEPPPVRQDNWISDECVIAIGYDAQDKVCHHGGVIGRPKEPSILDNILFQLRRMTGL